ncbi:MAG: c-type cytochrome [Deltaproteobacteria bacterium]
MKERCRNRDRAPLLGLIICILMVLAAAPDVYAQISPPEEGTEGRELFTQNRCANCHTVGRGRFVGPDLANIKDRYTKEEIAQWMQNSQSIYQSRGKMPVNEGYPPMPPMNVAPDTARLIADYLASLRPESLPKASAGRIGGKITPASGDPKSAAGIKLRLTAYLGDNPTDERDATVGEDGLFEFAGLPWDRAYTVTLNYKGTEYATDKMVFYPEEDAKTLDLPIYETTQSDENIIINAAHVIVQVSESEITVAEIMIINNSGAEVFIGEEVSSATEGNENQRRSLRFNLPKGADNLELLEGITPETLVKDIGGFSDSSAFSPGVRRVVYAYKLPYKAGKNVIETSINYAANGFVLLVSDTGAEVSVNGLEGGEAVNFDNSQFFRWSGKNLIRGASVRVEIGKSYAGGDWFKWYVFGALAILIGGAALYSIISRRKNPTQSEQKGESVDERGSEREWAKRINQIAELDDDFEAGRIAEADYKRLRVEYKDRLIEISQSRKRNTS